MKDHALALYRETVLNELGSSRVRNVAAREEIVARALQRCFDAGCASQEIEHVYKSAFRKHCLNKEDACID